MTQFEVSTKLASALNKLTTQDAYLFCANINERSLCARLAMYLQTEFSEYTVDCEYNRNVAEDDLIKRLRSYDLFELLDKTISADNTDGVTVYPDIIVHKRQTRDNLLVLEVKKSTNKTDQRIDKEKLRACKNELGYKYARFIVFGTNGEADLVLQNIEI